MSESLKQYEDTVTFLEGFLEFHPGYLDELTAAEREALSLYYFAGRDVDVESVAQYRDQVLATNPDLQAQALGALAKLKTIAGIR